MDNPPNPSSDDAAPQSSDALKDTTYPFSFTGVTEEFFRIWIVNMLLTLVTLGFYIPWARVRTRRYFHANTHLDGQSFDYLAKPINILWGYLIVLVVVGGYYAAGLFNPIFTVPFFFLYVFGTPWVIYKAMRFKAHNTSYRNVRFEFHGTVGEAYAIYLGMVILIPLTFGLIFPYWIMKQKEYFYKNLSFGGRRFDFTPQAGEYYTRYMVGGAIAVGLAMASGLAISGVFLSGAVEGAVQDPDAVPVFMFLGVGLSYGAMMLGLVFVQIYVYVSIFNYNMRRLLVGQTGFESALGLRKYYWITVTNIVATVFSLGLLAPWAAIRRTRYFAESVALSHPEGGLGELVSEAGAEQSALGDAAADMFEFDIGW